MVGLGLGWAGCLGWVGLGWVGWLLGLGWLAAWVAAVVVGLHQMEAVLNSRKMKMWQVKIDKACRTIEWYEEAIEMLEACL